MGALPNLLVIGGMKCGSSSLHRYLGQHPLIQMSEPKELNYLTRQKLNSRRGLDWYESHFDSSFPVRGESSPGYTFHPYARGAPERAAEIVPNARLIYVVRDPIDRLLSHYVHRVASGAEKRSFEEVMETLHQEVYAEEEERLPGPPGYLARSLYGLQLEQWRRCYPDSRILVIDHSELRDNRRSVLTEIERFLDLSRPFPDDAATEVINPSDGKRRPSGFGVWARWTGRRTGLRALVPVSARRRLVASRSFTRSFGRPTLRQEQRAQLEGLLWEDVSRFRSLVGKAFASWSI
jgi:hypothetical protein